jgi:hypothetical protein
MKGIGITFIALVVHFVSYGQKGSSCDNPLPIICNKYMHFDELFLGTLNDNGGLPCVDNFQEVAGIWLGLEIGKDGMLEFDLIPDDFDQDFDFTVFKGTKCNDLQVLRCVGGGKSYNSEHLCSGTTGLQSVDNDLFEFAGCSKSQNNYAAGIELVKGDHILLYIHRFDGVSGFGIMFQEPLLKQSDFILERLPTDWVQSEYSGENRQNKNVESQVLWKSDKNFTNKMREVVPPHFKHESIDEIHWKMDTKVFDGDCLSKVIDEVESIKELNRISVSPNPTQDFLSVKIEGQIPDELFIYYLNDGTLSNIFHLTSKSEIQILDVSRLQNGHYLLCDNTNIERCVKFIKIK